MYQSEIQYCKSVTPANIRYSEYLQGTGCMQGVQERFRRCLEGDKEIYQSRLKTMRNLEKSSKN